MEEAPGPRKIQTQERMDLASASSASSSPCNLRQIDVHVGLGSLIDKVGVAALTFA